jgi:hypothetical protein
MSTLRPPLPLDLMQPFSGLVLFTGHRSVLELSQLLCLQYLGRGAPVILVDGANALDLFLLSDAARSQQVNPQVLLDALRLSRVYTCHQLEALFTERLRPTIAALHPRAVLCLGLLDPLDDEDVPAGEAARIFRRLASTIRDVSRSLPILAVCPNPEIPGRDAGEIRRGFCTRLLRMARWHFTAHEENGRVWITRERPEPARWEWAIAARADPASSGGMRRQHLRGR